MTEIESGEMPATDAIAPETELVESSTTPETETPAETGQQTEAERDERGRFTGAQKRFDELTREKYDARREMEAERREKEFWRQRALEQEREKQVKPAQPLAPPNPNDFYDNPEGFVKAQQEFIDAQVDARLERQLSQRAAEEAERTRRAAYEKRHRDFMRVKPDFEQVVSDPSLPTSPTIAQVIGDSEYGPELSYYLGTNREKLEQIVRLPPHLAALELGRIEARLEAAKRPPPPTPAVSKAPPPPPTVEAVEPEVDKDPENMAINDWVKWREKQLRKRR
jgi:hypothetical protein